MILDRFLVLLMLLDFAGYDLREMNQLVLPLQNGKTEMVILESECY